MSGRGTPRYDPELLAGGDRRNVVDRYRYWRREAIVADLDRRRHDFHVAIENWQHDLNIGTVVRNANAFLAAEVHIVGRRRWNRRGAMVTDRYQHVRHHEIEEFVRLGAAPDLPSSASTTCPVACPWRGDPAPPVRAAVRPGGPGLSEAARARQHFCSIAQYGSTRSINAGVASGIAMHAWIARPPVRRRLAPPPERGCGAERTWPLGELPPLWGLGAAAGSDAHRLAL